MKTSYAYTNEVICNLTVRRGWSEGEIETSRVRWNVVQKAVSSTGCTYLTACLVMGNPKSVSMTVFGIISNHRLVCTAVAATFRQRYQLKR